MSNRGSVFTSIVATVALVIVAACDVPLGPASTSGPEVSGPETTPTFSSQYVFPSTNDFNRNNDLPHVNEVNVDIGEVTLEFVNETNSLAFFEYRIDGQVLTSGTAHPVVDHSFIYNGVCVDGRSVQACPGTRDTTFTANDSVQVRLALGGERDWDFDWVTFYVASDVASKDECKDGQWEDFGFKNQGQCVRFIETGKDSR